MTPTEAAALLACAAAFDNRKPDVDAATAWSVALDGFQFLDCRDAIVQHYRGSSVWLMPSHIIAEVRRVRSKRIAEDSALTPPARLDPDSTSEYAQWLAKARSDAADGVAVLIEKAEGPRRNILELGLIGTSVDDALALPPHREVYAEAKRAARSTPSARPSPTPAPSNAEEAS